jgi:hypothetical protein
VLRGHRLDRDGVHVLRVDHRLRQVEVGLQPDGHAGQELAEHRGDRGLPRHLDLERDLDLRTRADQFPAGQVHVLERQVGHVGLPAEARLAVLDPRQQCDPQ